MKTLRLNLSDNTFKKLQHIANKQGLTVEQLLINKIDHWLKEPDEDKQFSVIANYVIDKNQELYERLV